MKIKITFLLLLLQCSWSIAESTTGFPEAVHVYLTDGRVEAFPTKYVASQTTDNGQLTIVTTTGQLFTYKSSDVVSVSNDRPSNFPVITSFKINNKFNDQVFVDTTAVISGNEIKFSIAAIGKWLTPSFKLSDKQAQVYVDGVRQFSKESRLRFDKPINYVVANPKHTIYMPRPSRGGNVYTMQPYGSVFVVTADWLTDHATNVPRIDINTSDGLNVDSKEEYKTAEITFDGAGVYPSMTGSVKVKGRGNTSWNFDKKPYRLKFSSKVKPFGMKAGKNWVLLANNRQASLMTSAIGMKVACMVGTYAPNHIVPVELYMNGEYLGNYNLTEKVGFANNSIEFKDESAAVLLEIDNNGGEAATQKFKTITYGKASLPVNVKEPEFADNTTKLTLEQIKTDFNNFLTALKDGNDITPYVDVDNLARYLIVNEVVSNTEFMSPKSDYCFRESLLSDTSKYVFGPVWDLDYGFGYQKSSQYFTKYATDDFWTDSRVTGFSGYPFVYDLRYKSPAVDKAYRQEWKKFVKQAKELTDFCQDYYDYVATSIENDNTRWNIKTNYAKQVTQATTWLTQRIESITERLASTSEDEETLGDVNNDKIVNAADIVMAVKAMLDDDYTAQADINGDNCVTEDDMVKLIDLALETFDYKGAATQTTEKLLATVTDNGIDVCVENILPFTAFELTLTLPENLKVENAIVNSERVLDHQVSVVDAGQGKWKVIGFSMSNADIKGGRGKIFSLQTNARLTTQATLSDIYLYSNDTSARILSNATAEPTGIGNLKNDRKLSETIYDLQGRKVKTMRKGAFIHNHHKILK